MFWIFFSAFGFLFLAAELLHRIFNFSKDWTRTITHVGSGLISLYLPQYLSPDQIMWLAGSFILILSLSKAGTVLSLHGVERKTLGELFFPLTILLLPLICLPGHPEVFRHAVLILTFSDSLAGIVGRWKRIRPFRILGQEKTLGGTLTFFVCTLVILSSIYPTSLIGMIVLMSLFLALVETISVYGSDNLTVPLAAAGLEILFLV